MVTLNPVQLKVKSQFDFYRASKFIMSKMLIILKCMGIYFAFKILQITWYFISFSVIITSLLECFVNI